MLHVVLPTVQTHLSNECEEVLVTCLNGCKAKCTRKDVSLKLLLCNADFPDSTFTYNILISYSPDRADFSNIVFVSSEILA